MQYEESKNCFTDKRLQWYPKTFLGEFEMSWKWKGFCGDLVWSKSIEAISPPSKTIFEEREENANYQNNIRVKYDTVSIWSNVEKLVFQSQEFQRSWVERHLDTAQSNANLKD